MKIDIKIFTKILKSILGNNLLKKIAVGVSGGSDSMALSLLLQEFALQNKIDLTAITIDHNLRENSAKEANSVSLVLKKRGIKHIILQSYLDRKPQNNIEATMREVRYNLLTNFCHQNQIEYLFIGHHKGDLAENFLIRLFRGSGIDGLAAMENISQLNGIKLVRPLLEFNKEDLEKYLKTKNITWFLDESNNDEKYLRNKIRQFLQSLDDYSLINHRISLASKSILSSKKIIEEQMLKEAKQIINFSEFGYFLLKLEAFKNLSQEIAYRYLAWILMDVSGNFYKPRLEKLENFYNWIINDQKHLAKSFYGCITEKYNQEELIFYREKSKIKSALLENNFIWDNRFKIEITDQDSSSISSKKLLLQLKNLQISNLEIAELNQLAREIKKLKNLKNPLKKVFCTIPVVRKDKQIIAIPQLGYYNLPIFKKIKISFKSQTKLSNENSSLSN